MNIETVMQYVTYALILSGILAFLTSLIVQVIKELPGLKVIQTNVVALATSGILCVVATILLCMYFAVAVTWYYIVAALIAAFIVYLIATGGWDKLKEIWDRTKYKKTEGENENA